jgi:hypothetical protein
MSISSHASDGAAESCWQWRCRSDAGCGAMSLSSHDVTALPSHDVMALLWQLGRGVM